MFERHGRTPKTNTFTKHAGLLEVSQGSRPTFALLVCSTYVSPGCQRFWLPTPFCGLQANSLFANSGAQECSIKTFAMRPAMEWALINLHGDSSLEPGWMVGTRRCGKHQIRGSFLRGRHVPRRQTSWIEKRTCCLFSQAESTQTEEERS